MNNQRRKDQGNFIVRYWKSFLHALSGLFYSIKYEHNMIIMILATIVVVGAGFYYQINAYEWLFILFAIGSVTSTEMINGFSSEYVTNAKASYASLYVGDSTLAIRPVISVRNSVCVYNKNTGTKGNPYEIITDSSIINSSTSGISCY